ncbi:MAG: CCA tRNA nucleotidyltransferase [Planctomycetes bacterium]|nr:CCA tRNA nucleotidyltransferase [Planctomycetota bacterium]
MAEDAPQPVARQHRSAAQRAVQVLQWEGHAAYFAGGCVRDQLMGHDPSDYDVATDAPPEKVLKLFQTARLVGQAFGVVMVKVNHCWIEVATFRSESGYSDGRRPDAVEFTDEKTDAQRRDFTINGLFFDPVADRVIDYVDGQHDIERRLIRAIGLPAERFAEDYLRMLRAVRFAARFNFEIDPATAEAIKLNAPNLAKISRERIGAEVQMMFEHPGRTHAARLIDELHLDQPTLNGRTVDREPICLSLLDEWADFPTALAAWLIDRNLEPHRPNGLVEMIDALDRIKVVQIVRRWRNALMLSNEVRDALSELLLNLPRVLMWFDLNVAQSKRLLARDDWPRLHRLMKAAIGLCTEPAFEMDKFEAQMAAYQAAGVAPTPLLSGDDLIAEGMTPGPIFKQILDRVYDAQLSGAIATGEEAMTMAKSLAKEG